MYRARIARLSDYEDLASLCRRAVGPRDYVLNYLRSAITSGGVFVAMDDGKIIGMSNFQKAIDGSAWLSMARVDPDYWGKRIAGFLQKAMAAHAKKKGIRVLRLWILSTNTPSIKAALRGGFKPVCDAAHFSCTLRKTKTSSTTSSIALSPTELEIYSILNSRYISNGYFAHNWKFVRASMRTIRAIAGNSEIYNPKNGELMILFSGDVEEWGREKHAEFTLLSGQIGSLLEAVKRHAISTGVSSIGTFLPYNRYVMRLAREKYGFTSDKWGKHCIVFEKRI
jgi:GNAT superfamily N-acetyltransferase